MEKMSKIKTKEEIKDIAEDLRAKGKKIATTNGLFLRPSVLKRSLKSQLWGPLKSPSMITTGTP